jgi:nicotinamidase-related amidase
VIHYEGRRIPETVEELVDPAHTAYVIVVSELAPHPSEFVVRKHTSSSFVGTRLDTILRTNNIETVVLVGGVTEGCVESAARDACHHGYFVVLCESAVCSFNPDLHEASLKVMRRRYEVLQTADVLRVWESWAGAHPRVRAAVGDPV